ncbi:hypothetical protein J6590_011626 [Homalodisca vitripennis]|nr:hypothetical protein J6590_011626 [Homalodisca vitripennis]
MELSHYVRRENRLNILKASSNEKRLVQQGLERIVFIMASVRRGRATSFSGRSLKPKLGARYLDEPTRYFGVNIVAYLLINVPRPHLIN